MITIRNRDHAARLMRHYREHLGLTRQQLAARLFVSNVTVSKREYRERSIKVEDLIDHFHALGYDVALVPTRSVGRQTGTGWPG